MVRGVMKAALATTDAASGTPYASMILIATTIDGDPLTLISTLARHTANLIQSPQASILVDTSNPAGDATSGGRVSLMGRFTQDLSATSRARFLARHKSAAAYVDFADFSLYRMHIDSAHLIEGFGRIITLPGISLRAPINHPEAFAAAEQASLQVLRVKWPAVTGFDSEGVDLVLGAVANRFPFSTPCADAAAAQRAATEYLGSSDYSKRAASTANLTP